MFSYVCLLSWIILKFMTIKEYSTRPKCTVYKLKTRKYELIVWKLLDPEVFFEPCQTSKMECFVKIVNVFLSLSIFTKHYMIDVWQASEYASGFIWNKKIVYTDQTKALSRTWDLNTWSNDNVILWKLQFKLTFHNRNISSITVLASR